MLTIKQITENQNAVVYILDSKDDVLRKFRRAVTDSGSEVRAAEDKPGVTNLMTIYRCFTGKSFATDFQHHTLILNL